MEAEAPLQAPALSLPAQPHPLPALQQPARRASRSVCSPPEGPFSYDSPELVWEEGTYASTRFHSVFISAGRIQDFVLGENARGQTSFCVFKSERPWKAEQGLPSRTSVLSKVTYWCRAGPEDYSGRTPTGEPKGPGKRRSKIEHGESVKRGCQAHFTIRVLAREPEVAEIRMYQPAHVNTTGENCHNASTQRKGISHPRGKKLKSDQDGEQGQESMAVPQVPVLALPGMPGADQALRSSNAQGMGSQHYQEALQGSQPPAMDVIQHMAHMQALLAGTTSASLQDPNLGKMFSQGAYMEGPMGVAPLSQAEMPHASTGPAAGLQADMVNGSSSSVQLPAVAQLQLPNSQPDQAAAAHSAMSQQALTQAHEALMQQSMMAGAAANPAGAPGGPELPSSAGQGHGQPTAPLGQQEQPSAKQHMLHAISDGAAMVQAICAQIPTDNDPRCMAAADVQRKANAELLRIFSGA